mmetsp:Transcript_1570/g.3343  ORF Transcript_1570/g.3343 Transcript_1570/m.3343 type:complete len:663 (+) Transcript_1570:82-2070(+)
MKFDHSFEDDYMSGETVSALPPSNDDDDPFMNSGLFSLDPENILLPQANHTTASTAHDHIQLGTDLEDVFDNDLGHIGQLKADDMQPADQKFSETENMSGDIHDKPDEEFDKDFKTMLDGLGARACENEEDMIASILADENPEVSAEEKEFLALGDSGKILAPFPDEEAKQKKYVSLMHQPGGLAEGDSRGDTGAESIAKSKLNGCLSQSRFQNDFEDARDNFKEKARSLSNDSHVLNYNANDVVSPLFNPIEVRNHGIQLNDHSVFLSMSRGGIHRRVNLTSCGNRNGFESNLVDNVAPSPFPVDGCPFSSDASTSYTSNSDFEMFTTKAKSVAFQPGGFPNSTSAQKVHDGNAVNNSQHSAHHLVSDIKVGTAPSGTKKRRGKKPKMDLLKNVGMGFFSGIHLDLEAINKANEAEKEKEKQETANLTKRRRSRKKKADLLENVGMGFFSGMSVSPENMVEKSVEDEKTETQPRRRRRRNPKPDLLENITMGFFSMAPPVSIAKQSEQREFSNIIKPLYSWAPDFDEKTRVASEYALPVILPVAAVGFRFSSYGIAYAIVLPVLHTLECALTNFGPDTKSYRFSYAPISPFWHLVLDECLSIPLAISMIVFPQHFGPYSYFLAFYIFCNEYVHWAYAYKDIVRRRTKSKATKDYVIALKSA